MEKWLPRATRDGQADDEAEWGMSVKQKRTGVCEEESRFFHG